MSHFHRSPPRTRKRVAVVGAGPGGLAAAMLLARAGCDVTVHERHDRLGGRSGTLSAQTEAGRFRFDIGPTFFLYPRILEEVFAACGRTLRDEVELVRLDPQYQVLFEGGGGLLASGDPVKLAAEVAKLCPADAQAIPRFMAENRAKLAAFRPVLESAFNGPRDLLRPALLRALALLRPHRSVDGDLSRYFSDPRVRLAFSFQSKYLGMSPFRCPSLFTILSFMEYEYGVFHPIGGTGAVMAAMARAAEAMGARIRLREPVEEILFEGRRAVGVRVNGEARAADAVVVNADFAHAMRHLVPDQLRRRWSDRRLEKKRYSCSTFMLYLGLEGTEPNLAHHTIQLSGDYRGNLAAIEGGMAVPENPSFYVQNACVTDPSLAPPGHCTLYVLLPVGHNRPNGIDWPAQREAFRRVALDRLRALGIADVERRIRFERVFTPRDWEDEMHIHRGATFNLAHDLGQMLHRRPRNRFEELDGMYLVGGGTHPGSGLPVIFEGARITAKLVAEDFGLAPDWSTAIDMGADEGAPDRPGASAKAPDLALLDE